MRTELSATLILLAGIAVPSAASAAETQDSGPYLGASAGRTKATIDHDGIRANLFDRGFTTTSLTDSHRDQGYKFFGGYQFNKHFAVEGGFFDLGSYEYSATTLPLGTLTGSLAAKGVNLDVVGMVPFGQTFSVFGRLGATRARTQDYFTGTGAVSVVDPSPSSRDTNLKVGVGMQVDFSEAVGMRLEAERYRIDDAIGHVGDIDLLTLNVLVRFGGNPATLARVESPPPAPAARPQPPPAPAPAPPPAVVPVRTTEQYCSVLDIQFEIGQNEIELAEQERLRVLATFMTKYPATTAVIEGHSDDVGTAESNLRLSQQRAQGVVNYLATTHRIAASRLTAVGYGESRPLVSNSTEAGKRRNRRIGALISCATDIEGLDPVPARMTMALSIEFNEDQAAIGTQHRNEFRQVADYLTANPTATATVEGHSANADPVEAKRISTLRAQNAVNYLVENFSVARSRLTAEGFGQTRRVAYNTSADGREQNRRLNVVIDYPR